MPVAARVGAIGRTISVAFGLRAIPVTTGSGAVAKTVGRCFACVAFAVTAYGYRRLGGVRLRLCVVRNKGVLRGLIRHISDFRWFAAPHNNKDKLQE